MAMNNDNIFIIDHFYTIQKINRTLSQKIFNEKERYPHGQKCYEIFYDREKVCASCPVSQCVQEKRPFESENIADPKQFGLTRSVKAVPIMDRNGNVTQILVDCLGDEEGKDEKSQEVMTRMQLTLDGLLVLNSFNLEILNAIPHQAVVIDYEFNILSYNDAVLDYLQDVSEELVGRNLFRQIPAYNQWELRKAICDCIEDTERLKRSIILQSENEPGIWIEHHISQLGSNAGISAVLILSERKADSSGRDTEGFIGAPIPGQFESLSKLISRLSHDINNYLNIITNRLSWLKERFKPANPGESYNFKNEIQTLLQQVEKIGEVLYGVEMLQCHNSRDMTYIDIVELVENAITCATIKVSDRKNITVTKDYATDLPELVACEPNLEKALVEIYRNALEAARPAGQVWITIKEIDDEGGQIVLKIRDDGPGVAEENLNKIFNVFYTTKKDKKSAGLGLAVAAAIIHFHGGRIKVKSKKGSGTEVTVTLPLVAKPQFAECQ
jgi:signal transduction histidine kinase